MLTKSVLKSTTRAAPVTVFKRKAILIDLTHDADRTQIPRAASFVSYSSEGCRILVLDAMVQVWEGEICLSTGIEEYRVPRQHVTRIRQGDGFHLWPKESGPQAR